MPMDSELQCTINIFYNRIRSFILDKFYSHCPFAFTLGCLFLRNKIHVSFGLTNQTQGAHCKFTGDVLAHSGEVLKAGVI